jgi:hypothetical protein
VQAAAADQPKCKAKRRFGFGDPQGMYHRPGIISPNSIRQTGWLLSKTHLSPLNNTSHAGVVSPDSFKRKFSANA